MLSAYVALLWSAMVAAPVCGTDDDEPFRRALLNEINAERRAAGRPALTDHPALCEAALKRASMVATSGSVEPDMGVLKSTTRRLLDAGYQSHSWIESTLLGSRGVGILRQWREVRPEWVAQAVEGDFEDIGIGFARFGDQPVVSLLLALRQRTVEWRQAAPLADLAEVRRIVLEAVNAARVENRRVALRPEERLDLAAQRYAEDMLERSFYAHESPEGETVASRVRAAGYLERRSIAENIAKGIFTADEVVERWLASPGHRENILRKRAREMGVGVAFGENSNGFEVLWVQVFADGR